MGEGDREAVEGERLIAAKAPYFARLAHSYAGWAPQHYEYLSMDGLFHCIST
jgi:hypothetical protein